MRQERFTCRLCGSEGAGQAYAAEEMMFGSREVFTYLLCASCGCLQIRDVPPDLARHYPPDYYSQQPRTEPPAPRGLKGWLARWYCRSAVTAPTSAVGTLLRACLPVPGDFAAYGHYLAAAGLRNADERILDVGSGASPYRLAAMRRCGFGAVEGIDPFIAADTIYAGVPVLRRTIDQVQGSFALVMFHHSLEHVPDPVATLRHAARLLRPGGTCLVRIPVMGTHFWRRFGVRWVELDAPRHLYLMSLETMRQLARAAGLRVRRTVFDSEPWEVAGSLMYERGLPLRGAVGPEVFTPAERASFAELVDELNALGDAGRACFYLERV